MPITLNHSNIGVQYSSDKSYLIETVKSDLFVPVPTPMTPATEPTATPNRFVVQSFTYNGTGDFTPHTFVLPQNTLCDILVVGGGGGGGKTDAGGGGAGGLIYIQGLTLNGTYTINVGRGGVGGTSPSLIGLVGNKGLNSSLVGNNINYIAYGGGGGGYGHPSDVEPPNLGPYGSSGGLGTGDQIRESFNVNTIGQGHLGGLGTAAEGGGGGGGLGTAAEGGGGGGGSGGPGVNSGNGGVGSQINITGTNLFYAGGGAGGHNPTGTLGGLGGGGNAFLGGPGSNATFFGGGGGGGGGSYGNGGNGFAGIVIIRYVAFAIPEGTPTITHKTLNFAYVAPTLTYDFTNFNTRASWLAYAATIPTFTTSTLDFMFDNFDPDAIFWSSTNIGWVQMTLPSTHNFFSITYGLGKEGIEPVSVRLLVNGVVRDTFGTINNVTTYSQAYNPGDVVRIEETLSTMSGNFIFRFTNTHFITNQYTLTTTAGTQAQINGGAFQSLSGNYQVNVGDTQSSFLALGGQTNPFPATNGTTIAIRYSMIRQVPTLDPIGAQWTYSSSNTNVYHLGRVGIGTTSPEYPLDVRGSIFASTGGFTQSGLTTWSIASDRRIKENIVKASYDKCLENVKNIELYNFNFKENYVNTNDRHQLGFIAQEVQQIYPKAVEVNKMILDNNDGITDLLTLNTTQIDYTLYGAVKCLIEKIEKMEIELGKKDNTSNITLLE